MGPKCAAATISRAPVGRTGPTSGFFSGQPPILHHRWKWIGQCLGHEDNLKTAFVISRIRGKKFAHFVGLPDIILQGTATLAYAVKEITNREVGGNPYNLREISCKFTGMVIPGTQIEVYLANRIKNEFGTELYFEVYNNENKKAISNGYILIEN